VFLIKSPFDLRISAAALLLSLGLASPAFAHAHLVSATPAVNSMAMPAPTELRLKIHSWTREAQGQ